MKPPPLTLAITDAPRALLDLAVVRMSAPLLRQMPRARGNRSVMVIPGFLGSDQGNGPLIRYLRHLGYRTTGWRQGTNLGPESFDEDKLREALEQLAEQGDGQVSLVGHSLGGIYAREIARMAPETIRQVITLGSPFGAGHQQGSHANNLYQQLNPHHHPTDRDATLATPPPVPTVAIYTRGDGIVNWRTSRQDGNHSHVTNIAVAGSHIGLNVNAAVWFWVARHLARY